MDRKLVNTSYVMEHFGAGLKEQWELRKAGKLPFIRRGRRVFYELGDAEAVFVSVKLTSIEPESRPEAAIAARKKD